MGFEIISRAKWGAEPALSKIALKHPIPYVRTIALPDATPCKTLEECSKSLKEVQHNDMYDGRQQDIRSNFYIGDDGNVYEGRGWFSQAAKHSINHLTGQYVEIVHIGGKGDVPPTPEFVRAKQDLIQFGVKKKFINQFYTTI